jgi:hypothetical protein
MTAVDLRRVSGRRGRVMHAVLALLLMATVQTAVSFESQSASAQDTSIGRTLYVATWGLDEVKGRIPVNDVDHPWRTIALTIRRAVPGDTIVVSGGTYVENVGWGALPGSASARITLKSAPGERVVIKGTLSLAGANYWTVSGINVTDNPKAARTQFLVKFDGGHDWTFTRGEVWGSRGVSNLMVISSAKHGVASNYRIVGNCIHSNLAKNDPPLNDHNLYIYPGEDSGPGLIERNIIFGAANGADIKAAGSSAAGTGHLTIRYNTLADAKTGFVLGHGSNNIHLLHNLIVRPVGGAQGEAAIRVNHLYGLGNSITDSSIQGFSVLIRSWSDSVTKISASRVHKVNSTFNRVGVCSGYRALDPASQLDGRFAPSQPGDTAW